MNCRPFEDYYYHTRHNYTVSLFKFDESSHTVLLAILFHSYLFDTPSFQSLATAVLTSQINIYMFANAYQNGPYLEIWDSKCTLPVTQPTLTKNSSSNNSSASLRTPSSNTSIKIVNAISTIFKDKTVNLPYLLMTHVVLPCINSTLSCKSTYPVAVNGQWT